MYMVVHTYVCVRDNVKKVKYGCVCSRSPRWKGKLRGIWREVMSRGGERLRIWSGKEKAKVKKIKKKKQTKKRRKKKARI